MGYNEKAILHTLLYSDLFNYPLTREEIWEYFIGSSQNVSITKNALKNLLQRLSSHISQKDSLYCIRGREHIIEMRKKRLFFSQIKRKMAEKIARKLSVIPSVLCIGISGACAVDNASENDDIDLFIITKENTLWISRLLILIILQLFGVRRSKNEKNVKDRFCVNMLIDERCLHLGKDREEIYSAHEIAQIRTLFDRYNTYNKFLAANLWVKIFLPNSFVYKKIASDYKVSSFEKFINTVFKTVEPFVKYVQLLYMKKHISKETIRDGFLAFHPFDYREYILKKFNKTIKQYEAL